MTYTPRFHPAGSGPDSLVISVPSGVISALDSNSAAVMEVINARPHKVRTGKWRFTTKRRAQCLWLMSRVCDQKRLTDGWLVDCYYDEVGRDCYSVFEILVEAGVARIKEPLRWYACAYGYTLDYRYPVSLQCSLNDWAEQPRTEVALVGRSESENEVSFAIAMGRRRD